LEFASIQLVSRCRALVAASSIALHYVVFVLAYLYCERGSLGWLRLVDMAFWILFLGSTVAGFLDLKLHWKNTPVHSTILLTIIGVSIVIIARSSSVIYSLIETSFYTQAIGGSMIDDVSYKLAITAIFGSYVLLASTTVSTLYGKHVVFREAPTLHSALLGLTRLLGSVKPRTLYIISFLTGFLVRLYPEVKYVELPIGWDTLEYISVARDFSQEPRVLTTYLWLGGWRNLPPLLTWIPGVLAWINVDPWLFFKVFPPAMMGALSATTSAIAYGVSRSKWIALASSLLVVFNPYVLGQSQQWHRHLLGLVLLMVYIYLCEKKSKVHSRVLVLALAALSYEIAAVLALLLSLSEALASRGWRNRGLFMLSTALSLLALLWYVNFPVRPLAAMSPTGVAVTGNVEYSPGPTLKYTIVCALLLSPSLVVIKIWKRIDWRARLLIVALFTAFILPTISVIAPLDQHRWFTMLLTILTPYTIAGLAELDVRLAPLLAVITVILGSAYPFTESGYVHFAIYPAVSTPHAQGYPWKMGPSLRNITDLENTARIIKVVNEVVLVNLHLYPQLHLYVRNPKNVIVTSQELALPMVVAYGVNKNLSRMLVITATNMAGQLEEYKANPSLYNATMAPLLSREKYISVDKIECQVLYRGGTFNVYLVEIRKE